MWIAQHRYGITATAVCVAVLCYLTYFQVQRGSPRDLAIFAGVTLAVIVGIGRTTPRAAVRRPDRDVGPTVLVAAAFVAMLLAVTPRFGTVDVVVVGALGVIALVLAWGPGDQPDAAVGEIAAERRGPVARAGVAWLAVVVALGIWQLISYAPGPTISDLVDPNLNSVTGRAVFAVVWLAGLYGLLRHAWRPVRPGPPPQGVPTSIEEPT